MRKTDGHHNISMKSKDVNATSHEIALMRYTLNGQDATESIEMAQEYGPLRIMSEHELG